MSDGKWGIRSETIRARVTPPERQALVLIAKDEGRQVSEMLRELVRLAARERGLWPVVKESETD